MPYEKPSETAQAIKDFVKNLYDNGSRGTIEVKYSGYGDEGEITNVNLTNCNVDQRTFEELKFERLVYNLLDEYHSGWEINEGQSGTVTINIDTGHIGHVYTVSEPKEYSEEF